MKNIKKYIRRIESIEIVLWFALALYSFFLINTILKWL